MYIPHKETFNCNTIIQKTKTKLNIFLQPERGFVANLTIKLISVNQYTVNLYTCFLKTL